MKLLLNLLLSASSTSAYLSTSPTFLVHRRHTINQPSRQTSLYYKDPGSSGGNDGTDNSSANVWSVLANTERWISDTLDKSNKAANARRDAAKLEEEQKQQKQMEDELEQKINMHFAYPKQNNNEEKKKKKKLSLSQAKDNPYVRKEVSYVCEVGTDLPSVVGGIFRRVKEARELGEAHGRDVEARSGDSPSSSQPTTMRQTNVVVIPNADELQSFDNFDKLVMAINQARRSARDFVLKKKDDDEDDGKEWTVSINCAHLHPQYGIQSPEEQLAELKHEEEEGEVDVNMQEYKKQRDEARRSPYPSVIVEVQSTPPPDFGTRRDEAAMMMEAAAADMMGAKMSDNSDGDVTSEDVKKLETLFGLSAAKKSTKPDDPFYDALGEAFGNKQVISTTPLQQVQNWVLQNDPAFNEETSTFTKSDTRHVDSAYEYIFNTIAMLNAVDENTTAPNDKPKRGQKSYVVLPNFLPTSATSFDRFAGQVSNILRVMPSMSEKAMLSTFHPEHVVGSTRSPVPVLVITWK